jgi:hypothetical protein
MVVTPVTIATLWQTKRFRRAITGGYGENMLASFYQETITLLTNKVRTPMNPFYEDLGKKLTLSR